jgi:hypothetical protein
MISNYSSILQTKFSDREGHEARGIGLEAMPLDRTRSASENRNHAAACDSILWAGRREGAASPRRAAS